MEDSIGIVISQSLKPFSMWMVLVTDGDFRYEFREFC